MLLRAGDDASTGEVNRLDRSFGISLPEETSSWSGTMLPGRRGTCVSSREMRDEDQGGHPAGACACSPRAASRILATSGQPAPSSHLGTRVRLRSQKDEVSQQCAGMSSSAHPRVRLMLESANYLHSSVNMTEGRPSPSPLSDSRSHQTPCGHPGIRCTYLQLTLARGDRAALRAASEAYLRRANSNCGRIPGTIIRLRREGASLLYPAGSARAANPRLSAAARGRQPRRYYRCAQSFFTFQ